MSCVFVDCSHDEHATGILEILNEAILTSTALFDYRPRTPENMAAWFRTKGQGNFPVIGAVTGDGTLAGFATFGSFRAWPAYKYSVEHSVYVHREHRARGLGRALMNRLIARAGQQQYHLMVAGIDAANTATVALHIALAFTHA